jgi:hypothetical protein
MGNGWGKAEWDQDYGAVVVRIITSSSPQLRFQYLLKHLKEKAVTQGAQGTAMDAILALISVFYLRTLRFLALFALLLLFCL